MHSASPIRLQGRCAKLLRRARSDELRSLRNYIAKNKADFNNIEFSEKGIELHLGDGVSVVGRIDLVRRKDTNEVTVVDMKTSERSQAEDVTEVQLHIYALGYQEPTGKGADYVEIYELEEQKRKPRSVDDDFIAAVKTNVKDAAANSLRSGVLPAKPSEKTCNACDFKMLCSQGCKFSSVKSGRCQAHEEAPFKYQSVAPRLAVLSRPRMREVRDVVPGLTFQG